jgi:hypothetical protein|tara:strand:+ start:7603 stop:9942 length:2340 start_codon:yes stop_codon:yes gene_type:complete
MNILEIEDMIKGLPDQALQREAQMPSGRVPQFLVVSEIQRRGDMRKRFSERQPQGTVKDQVIQEGIAAMAPPEPQMQSAMMGMQQPMPQAMQQSMPQGMQQPMPMDQPPMGMFEGGVVQMANGMQVPGLQDQFRQAKNLGLGYQEAIDLASKFGLSDFINTLYSDDSEMANIQANVGTPVYQPASMAPRDIPFGREFEEDSMLDRATSFINQALAPPPATGGRSVGNLFGSDMPAPTSATAAAPLSAAPVAASVPNMASPDTSLVNLINTALAPPAAPGTRSVGNLFGSDVPAPTNVSGTAPSSMTSDPLPMQGDVIKMPTAPEQLTDRQASMQQMIERIQKRQADAPIIPDFLTQDTKPMLQARERYSDSPVQQMITQANQPQQTPFSPENYERMIASLEGTGLDSALASPLPTQTIDIVKLAEQSLRQQGLPGPQAQDGSRLDEDDAVQETQELAGAADSTASLSGTPEQVVPGANTAGPKDTPTPDAGGGAKQGTGASAEGQRLRSVTETLTDDFLESMVGDESIVGQIKAKSSSLAKAIRNRERPTLDYSTLIAEYEAQMQPEIDALKKERGSQALIALGAGIAKGDLSAGLSGAAKAAAASNAERRALKAKQQAAQMGLKKSQVDAAYQNDLEQSADEIKAIAAEVEALKGYGIAVRQAESMAFSKAAEAEKVIAKMAADRDLQAARLAQDSEREQGLLRRAAIDAAKEFIRSLDDVTVARLGEKGIRDEFNRAIVEYAGALGANLQSDLTASRQSEGSTGDMSIGGYRVREST